MEVFNRLHRYTLLRCENCHFIFVYPIPPREDLTSLYGERYFQNPAFDTLDQNNYYGYDIYISDKVNIQRKFARCLYILNTFLKKGKLLDVGCATGFFLELASQWGYETTGVEISDFASRYAVEKLGLTVFNKDLTTIHFPDSSFDIVTLWDVIEHLPDPQADICEINRVLVEGGILGIITPDIGAFIPRVLGKHWLELQRVPEHLSFFSRSTLITFLARAGFEVLKITTIGKKFFLDSLIKNMSFQRPVGQAIVRWIRTRRFPSWKIPCTINPRYKMLVIARKVRSLPEGRILPLS